MEKRTIVCDIENLYQCLKNSKKPLTLMNDCEVSKTTDGEWSWCDITRQGGTIPILCDGEVHTFIQNKDKTWSNVPTEDSGNHEVILTEQQFAYISGYE